MKIAALVLMFIVFDPLNTIAQRSTVDARIESIRDAYKNAKGKVAELEKAPEFSSVFVVEVVANKHNAPYPAVGIYNSTTRMYYTYGNRETDPYPNRMIIAVVTTKRSSRTEFCEYLFSQGGDLLFALVKDPENEIRGYFDKGRLIRIQNGNSKTALNDALTIQTVRTMIDGSRRVQGLFRNAL